MASEALSASRREQPAGPTPSRPTPPSSSSSPSLAQRVEPELPRFPTRFKAEYAFRGAIDRGCRDVVAAVERDGVTVVAPTKRTRASPVASHPTRPDRARDADEGRRLRPRRPLAGAEERIAALPAQVDPTLASERAAGATVREALRHEGVQRRRQPRRRGDNGLAHSRRPSRTEPKVEPQSDTAAFVDVKRAASDAPMGREGHRDHDDGPEGEELRGLPDLIEPDIDVLFVGSNPGLRSSALQHHFAHPSNHFYRALHLSGLTPERIPPTMDASLLRSAPLRMGFTNLCARPTRQSAELARGERRAGPSALAEKMARNRVKVAVMVGKAVGGDFAAEARRAASSSSRRGGGSRANRGEGEGREAEEGETVTVWVPEEVEVGDLGLMAWAVPWDEENPPPPPPRTAARAPRAEPSNVHVRVKIEQGLVDVRDEAVLSHDRPRQPASRRVKRETQTHASLPSDDTSGPAPSAPPRASPPLSSSSSRRRSSPSPHPHVPPLPGHGGEPATIFPHDDDDDAPPDVPPLRHTLLLVTPSTSGLAAHWSVSQKASYFGLARKLALALAHVHAPGDRDRGRSREAGGANDPTAAAAATAAASAAGEGVMAQGVARKDEDSTTDDGNGAESHNGADHAVKREEPDDALEDAAVDSARSATTPATPPPRLKRLRLRVARF